MWAQSTAQYQETFKERTLTVSYSNLKFSFHVCGVKVKPCGCFQGAEIEPGISPGTRSTALNLDFVTQLPQGDNGLSKPSLSSPPSPWDWPFHCHARIFYIHSTPNTHSLSSMDLFILNPPRRAGKWDLGDGIKIQQKLILKPSQRPTYCVPGPLNQCFIRMLNRTGYSCSW